MTAPVMFSPNGSSTFMAWSLSSGSRRMVVVDVYADLFDDDLDELSERMGEMLARENVGKMWANEVSRAA